MPLFTKSLLNRLKGIHDYNVKSLSYGAIGNGTTNDAPAINAAIIACRDAGGGVVDLPSGIYSINSSIIMYNGVALKGAGISTIIQQSAASSNSIAIINADAVNGNDDISITDLVLDCNRANRPAATNVGIRLIASDANACNNILIKNVWVKNVPYAATQFMNCVDITVDNIRMDNTVRDGLTFWFNSRNIKVSNVRAKDIRDDCIALNSEADSHVGTQIKNVEITNCILSQATDSVFGSGIRVAGAENVSISNVDVEYSQGWGLVIEGGLISNASLKSRNIKVSNYGIQQSGTATSGNGGIATSANEVEDVTITTPVVKNSYGNAINLEGRATVIGAKVRGGVASTSVGINIAATGCVVTGGTIEATPSSGVVVAAEKANVSGVTILECCVSQGGAAYLLVSANINRAAINGIVMQRVSTGGYGVRIASGTSTGVNVKGSLAQGFTVGNGFSDGSSGGTNDITGNLSV